jgi:AAA15 family ATPase/GTPase
VVYVYPLGGKMIDKLAIKNFKSIKELDIDCRRINLFIGEPNTGKSNIMEALGFLSWIGNVGKLNEFIRFESISDLFFDNLLEEDIDITIQTNSFVSMNIAFRVDNFEIKIQNFKNKGGSRIFGAGGKFSYTGEPIEGNIFQPIYNPIKYYKFLRQHNFPGPHTPSLLPPHGYNLFAMAMGDKKISERINSFFEHLNLKIMLDTRERTLGFVKQEKNRIIRYPYTTTSETLQRIIFYTIAMETNTNATLIFEEPESFAFPYYTKFLGERIAFDDKNQYFISTHNPYLLLAILEKAPKDSVYLFITYLENYQTKLRRLTDKEILILMDSEPFFNLGYFLEEE